MGWQPGPEDGAGNHSDRDPGMPDAATSARDPRLAGFTQGGEWDTCAPSGRLAALLDELSGPEQRCPWATDDELVGVLRRFAAVESWAAAAKLGVIRELIRRDDAPAASRPRHGDLPDEWSDSLDHELALALASSVQSARGTALTAWELGARLPRIAALLAEGVLTFGKARLVAETFQWLSDDDAARAEALLVPELAGHTGKTFGQLVNLAARIATQVDPGFAERRRKAAVKDGARVQMFREQSGAVGLSGRDLPTDQALAANANVCARAAEYKDSGAFGDARMDQLRVTAYLDMLNEVTTDARIAYGRLVTDEEPPDATGPNPGPGGDHADTADNSAPDSDRRPGDGGSTGNPDPGDGGNPSGGPDTSGGPDIGSGGGNDLDVPPAPAAGPTPRPVDLVIPLATLLGLAERPGEGHGLGPLDPGLCRDLATAAVSSPHSAICVTVTSQEGSATGHGCARLVKPNRGRGSDHQSRVGHASQPNRVCGSLIELPARLNLTITSAQLAALAVTPAVPGAHALDPPRTWTFTRDDATGPPGGSISFGTARVGKDTGQPVASADGDGAWTLTAPGGRRYTVRLEPVPVDYCDHRHETSSYEPGTKLRHLVQVRDYACTFPSCSRHARESDFEHALPYDKGGRTCACNAGARSRQCHRIKQSPGWNVTQPRPGWHQWTTPSGRIYTQAPYHYPV